MQELNVQEMAAVVGGLNHADVEVIDAPGH